MAFRNAAGVALPLGIGIAIGHPLAAVAVATGALNVAYSDGRDPYAHRARRMLGWTLLGAVAVFLGSVTGNYHVLAVIVAFGWSLMAGLLVSISTRAGDLGLNTLVTLIVYAARGALSPKGAFYAGLLVLGGGLLQTALALMSWPIRRSSPERKAIGGVYLDLAEHVGSEPEDVLAAPLKQPSAAVQDTLSALGRDHSLEGERFRLLYDQAERVRFSIYSVRRLKGTLEHALRAGECCEAELKIQKEALDLSQTILRAVGQSLVEDRVDSVSPDLAQQLNALTEEIQTTKGQRGSAADQLAGAMDVLAGQLRVIMQLATNSTTEGAEAFAKREYAPPIKLQLQSWLATLRANLHFGSPAFRHAVRMAVCVAIGTGIGRSINTQRNYWLPMTVAVVLKPDFTTTISRGVLRLGGTFAGLLLATLCYHVVPHTAFAALALVGIYTFALRYAGPANYGIFSVAISGLIVFLIAITGVSPMDVIGQRAVNTAAGGLLALIAYAVWPTWERTLVPDAMAEMIDRTRDYFRAVAKRLSGVEEISEDELDSARDAWRQARSRAEASLDRVCSEPGADQVKTDALTSILASSHAFVRGVMSLEAFYIHGPGVQMPAAFQTFAQDVDFTLYYLAAALRGSEFAAETLPSLREDHRKLLEEAKSSGARDEYLLIETDRLTVSMNTMREQVLRFVGLNKISSERQGPVPLPST